MGYYLSSIYGISPTESHNFFIYYITGNQFEHDLIYNWIFGQIEKIVT